MTVNFATALNTIENPSKAWFDESKALLETIIQKTLEVEKWQDDNIDAEKEKLIEQGTNQMNVILGQ